MNTRERSTMKLVELSINNYIVDAIHKHHIAHTCHGTKHKRAQWAFYVPRSLQSWVSTTHRSYSQLTFFNIKKHYIKYLALYVLCLTMPTIQEQSKHLRSLMSASYIIKWKTRISSKLIFASCVGYFDRAHYGFKVLQLWNSVNVEICDYTVDIYVTLLVDVVCIVCMRPYWWTQFVWGGINGHTFLGESGKLLS